MARSLPAALVDGLAAIVGSDHVLTDPSMTAGAAVDWTGRFRGETPALVRPADHDQVAALVAWCRHHRVALVPQGGNTGLVGGGVPRAGEVVVSLTRLDHLDVDGEAGQVTAGAGATLVAVQQAAAASGWRYAVDLAARDSATIGGTVATNAGGLRVLRWGPTRAQLLGVRAVLGTGETVEHLRGLEKDNTGLDLGQLLCGSEGVLGIVTAARLRLRPPAGETVTALLALSSVSDAVAATTALRRALPMLEAAELYLAAGAALVTAHTGRPVPVAGAPVYLLVEAVGPPAPLDPLAAAVGALAVPPIDVAVATDGPGRAGLWHHREAHTESIASLGVVHKLDVTVPLPGLAAFCDEVHTVVRAARPRAACWLFGHVGDGNVHVNITGVDPDDDDIDEQVLTLVIDRGGSISAEHGIGVAKRRWLARNRSAGDLDTMRRIKAALDPAGICNPGVLV